MLLLEPAAGVEQRITDWLHLNLAVSYRLVSGVERAGLKNGDFNSAAVGEITLGKEWWVGSNCGLGVSGAAAIHDIPDGWVDKNWKGTSFALRFSATLN